MQLVFGFILELLIIITHFPLWTLNALLPFKTTIKKPKHPETIIIVERWFRRNSLHIFMKWYFEKKGYSTYSLNIGLTTGTFEQSAHVLKDFIDTKNLEKVVLIGLSNGGLTCLTYLEELNGWEKTDKLICVATPFCGTPIAKLIFYLKSIHQLYPNSSYLKTVASYEIKHPERILNIRAKYDEMVPGNCSYFKGVKNSTLSVFGHNVVHTIWHPTYKEIVRFIS